MAGIALGFVAEHAETATALGFLKSVILRVSEARDLGDSDRYAFYDHMKSITAAPPDVLRIDEKNRAEYMIPNVAGVVITTNHKDRRDFLTRR